MFLEIWLNRSWPIQTSYAETWQLLARALNIKEFYKASVQVRGTFIIFTLRVWSIWSSISSLLSLLVSVHVYQILSLSKRESWPLLLIFHNLCSVKAKTCNQITYKIKSINHFKLCSLLCWHLFCVIYFLVTVLNQSAFLWGWPTVECQFPHLFTCTNQQLTPSVIFQR